MYYVGNACFFRSPFSSFASMPLLPMRDGYWPVWKLPSQPTLPERVLDQAVEEANSVWLPSFCLLKETILPRRLLNDSDGITFSFGKASLTKAWFCIYAEFANWNLRAKECPQKELQELARVFFEKFLSVRKTCCWYKPLNISKRV